MLWFLYSAMVWNKVDAAKNEDTIYTKWAAKLSPTNSLPSHTCKTFTECLGHKMWYMLFYTHWWIPGSYQWGWAMRKKISTILLPYALSTCSTGGFCCHCPSAQEGLGMLPKEGREETVVTLMESEDSNKTQESRDNLVFIKPMKCSQYQAP